MADIDPDDLTPAFDDPALHAAAAKIAAEESNEAPRIPFPQDGPVTLPGGFRRMRVGKEPEEVRTAWVRELNGEDEERIAKARLKESTNEFVRAILEGGVERLGDSAPTRDDFDSLLIGDLNFLLLEISKATFGDDLEFVNFTCPYCNVAFDFTVHKSEDIPGKTLESLSGQDFEVDLRRNRKARVHLPTVEIQNSVVDATTDAEANTILLASCVEEIVEESGTAQAVAGDKDTVRALGVQDRQTILMALDDRMPGPRYTDIRFHHDPGCGREITLGVTPGDLFRGL